MRYAVRKGVSVLLITAVLMSAFVITGITTVKTGAASWNGTNYGGGSVAGYRTFLEAFGIDYDVYMKWMDDHDADSANPSYYLGTPYVGFDHRNPNGDCAGAYGDYDEPGVGAMNCTGFVWHVLYKAAVHSGASYSQINRLEVMWRVPVSWAELGIYRVYFDSIEDVYNSGVLEKGDLMWIYGSSDSHNAIFYGDSPEDFIYWDSAGERNRYSKVHSIGTCLGLWVAKVTQPDEIELHADAPLSGTNGSGASFGAKYCIFNSRSDAQAAVDNPGSMAAWDERIGTIVLNSNGHGSLKTVDAPAASELYINGQARTGLSYFSAPARRVDASDNYYAVQWSAPKGEVAERRVLAFYDSGERTPTGYRIFRFKILKKVATPSFSEIKCTGEGVSLSWKGVSYADRYRVYYKNSSGGWTRMTETAGKSYVDTKVNRGSAYTYTIRCVDKDGDFISDYNPEGWRVTYDCLDTPQIISHETTPDGILLTWNEVEGAEKYRVYYKNSKGGWNRMTETADTSYLDEEFNVGSTYTYTVRCVDSAGEFTSGFDKTGWKHTYEGIAVPILSSVESEAQGVRLSWEPSEGAAEYRLYHKSGSGWTRIGQTDGSTYLDDSVDFGDTNIYTIRCVNARGSFISDFDRNGVKCTYEGVETPLITEAVSEAEGVRLRWEPVEGAQRYRVYCLKREGGWARIAEITDTEYFDGVVTLGKDYTYTVRCVSADGRFMSDYNRAGVNCVYNGLDTPVISSLESAQDGVAISWDAVDGAAVYRVFCMTASGWERLGDTSDTSFLHASAVQGETYTYTLRCVGSKDNYVSLYDKKGSSITFTPKLTAETGLYEEPT